MEYIQCYHMILSIVHLKIASYQRELISQEKGENPLKTLKDILYTPYISRTDIFAVLDCLGNFAKVKFRDFCDVFITVHSHIY